MREEAFRRWLPIWTPSASTELKCGLNFVFVLGSQGALARGRFVLRSARDISSKDVQKSWAWFKESLQFNPDYVFKMDTDTAICPTQLLSLLEEAASEGATYIGKELGRAGCGDYSYCPEPVSPSWNYMSGSFYGLHASLIMSMSASERAASLMMSAQQIDSYKKNSYETSEDLVMGKAIWTHSRVLPTTFDIECLISNERNGKHGCPVFHNWDHKAAASARSTCSTKQRSVGESAARLQHATANRANLTMELFDHSLGNNMIAFRSLIGIAKWNSMFPVFVEKQMRDLNNTFVLSHIDFGVAQEIPKSYAEGGLFDHLQPLPTLKSNRNTWIGYYLQNAAYAKALKTPLRVFWKFRPVIWQRQECYFLREGQCVSTVDISRQHTSNRETTSVRPKKLCSTS